MKEILVVFNDMCSDKSSVVLRIDYLCEGDT